MLTVEEADYSRQVLRELENVQWAAPLLRMIERNGGVCEANKHLLFEARVASEILHSGITPDYEFSAAVGDTTVDFRIQGSPDWLVELVMIDQSEASARATETINIDGHEVTQMLLSGTAEDQRSSPAGEVIKLQEKIAEKVFNNLGKKFVKFPKPTSSTKHIILVNDSEFAGGFGSLIEDRTQAVYGIGPLQEQNLLFVTSQFSGADVLGLFDPENKRPSAKAVQERIHAVAFVRESEFVAGEIIRKAQVFINPLLVDEEQLTTIDAKFHVRTPETKIILDSRDGGEDGWTTIEGIP